MRRYAAVAACWLLFPLVFCFSQCQRSAQIDNIVIRRGHA